MIEDKRKSIRVPVNIPARFLLDREEYEALALNISEDGIFLKTGRVVSEHQSIEIFFRLPETRDVLRLKGRVIWSTRVEGTDTAVSGMGAQFEQVPEEQKEELRQFIERLLKG